MLKAMIMAAGMGERLMPLTADLPKPMLPMLNRPLISNVIQSLAQASIDNIAVNLHYRGDVITDYLGTGESLGVTIRYSHEKQLMGTAGGVKLCQTFFDDTFVVMSGDGLTDIDLTRLVAEHQRRGALASIALKEMREVESYGVVRTGEDGRITAFQEKPRHRAAISNLVNIGIYIFEPEIFDFIPIGQFYDFGRQVFPALVEAGTPFYGIPVEGYWCDIGNLETYLQGHYDVLEGLCRYDAGRGWLDRWSDGAKLAIGDSCDINAQAYLQGRTTIGSGCVLGKRCLVNDAVIWGDTVIGSHTVINGAIIGSGCCIESNCYLEPGTVVASGCRITSGTRLTAGSQVFKQNDEQVVRTG